MSRNNLSENAMKMLSEGLSQNTKLTDLFFTHNDLQLAGEGGVQFIRSLKNKKDLRVLALNSCNLNGDLLEELKESLEAQHNLKELFLFANKIEKEGAASISAILRSKTGLSSLGLSNNKLDMEGTIEIAKKGLTGKTELVKLSIENNIMGN
jgi:Ran GTPase-activating protein (RanGAP) involved in mRNA processing and transport